MFVSGDNPSEGNWLKRCCFSSFNETMQSHVIGRGGHEELEAWKSGRRCTGWLYGELADCQWVTRSPIELFWTAKKLGNMLVVGQRDRADYSFWGPREVCPKRTNFSNFFFGNSSLRDSIRGEAWGSFGHCPNIECLSGAVSCVFA